MTPWHSSNRRATDPGAFEREGAAAWVSLATENA